MPTDLTVMTLAERLAEHAAARQSLVSGNIANADTLGYRALDLSPFQETYAARTATEDAASFRPAASRPGHAGFEDAPSGAEVVESARQGAAAPNGNDVSLEDQMTRAAELRLQHDMALGVWRKSLDIVRASLGRIR